MHLMPEERDNVETLIAEAQEEVHTGDTGFIANKVAARLARAAIEGVPWARSALEYFAEQRLQTYIKEEMRGSDLTAFRHPKTGVIIKRPSRIGVQARNDEGVKENYHQQEFWWVLHWPTLTEKVNEYIKHRDAADTNITMFMEVLKLRDRFPETMTAEEACEMAGIDPRAFGIEGDALTGTDD